MACRTTLQGAKKKKTISLPKEQCKEPLRDTHIQIEFTSFQQNERKKTERTGSKRIKYT